MASEVGKVAIADVDIAEVYEQITDRIELENAVTGMVGATARRIVVTIFELMRLRRERRLPVYPARVVQGVLWLLVKNH